MLCSKCYEKIIQDEEIQVENSIICQKCALINEKNKVKKDKIVAKCCTCFWPIYKSDLTHEISGSVSFGIAGFLGFSQNGKSIHCDWCYNQWLKEFKKEEKWWK